ncbi:Methyltransferase domain-containing protein [Arboricoccus pini]|uniref:Methyltransferase domain-containing protein n=2 Tax=Arboricoccus pini TaxID=1963835 RepID=A0A212Q7R0_9PROT|nr:Methyltransferase domain-containing protein [Arboricoccus pini]
MPDRWQGYYDATAGRPPRHTLVTALQGFEREGIGPALALDLGCGAGRETLPMLRAGWRVVAIDSTSEGLERLRAALEPGLQAQLTLREDRLETADLPLAKLVNASFVLPFLEKEAFLDLWQRINRALEKGGRFAGQLFGPDDSWVRRGTCHGHDRLEIDRLTKDYAVELLEEESHEGITPRGTTKYWHIWHLVLHKP